MGKLNEIQEEVKQSYGSNSFTTTIKDNTVEFDSAKDSFTFKDEVNVPSLKINGETVQAGPADWNTLENKPFYESRYSISTIPADYQQGETINLPQDLWNASIGNVCEAVNEAGTVTYTSTKLASGMGAPAGTFSCRLLNNLDETIGTVNFENYKPTTFIGSATLAGFTLKYVDLKTLDSKFIPQLGGVEFKVSGGDLMAKVDGDWVTITVS